MSEKLKPCPFCGSKDITIHIFWGEHRVTCDKCGTQTTGFYKIEEAERAWNKWHERIDNKWQQNKR